MRHHVRLLPCFLNVSPQMLKLGRLLELFSGKKILDFPAVSVSAVTGHEFFSMLFPFYSSLKMSLNQI